MNTTQFFNLLWNDYVEITPQAQKVHDLFSQAGESVINDHVAFRTFSDSPIELERLEPIILALGYRRQGEYHFEQKKLMARSYSHPVADTPRIFISELQRHWLSAAAQQILAEIVSQIPASVADGPEIFTRGLLWQPVTLAQYRTLVEESEYAGWLASMGLRANHFTVSLNHLKGFSEMDQVIALLESNGYPINRVGGAIKGTPADLLVQSSTLADRVKIRFQDGLEASVPSCFYEFAKRFTDANGQLFDAFIADNADKIFESTNAA